MSERPTPSRSSSAAQVHPRAEPGGGHRSFTAPRRADQVTRYRPLPPMQLLAVLITAGIALCAAPAEAEDAAAPPEGPAKDWRVTIAPYAWLTSLNGNATIAGIDTDVDVGFGDILKNLNMAGMLLVDVQKGRWIANVNFVGARIKDDSADNLDVTSDTVQLGSSLAYLVVDHQIGESGTGEPLTARLGPLVGARLTYLRAEIDNRAGPSADRSESWVDPLVGFRGGIDLSERWRIVGEGDIGGFGVGSDLAWNAQAFLTYRTSFFGVAADLAVGYRALSQDYDRNGFKYDVTMYGPVLGAAFHF